MAKKEAPAPEGERNSSNSIFWRTFLMLMVLIVVSVLGGLQTYWTFNEESIARSISQQIVSMTNLTRYALISADPVYRPGPPQYSRERRRTAHRAEGGQRSHDAASRHVNRESHRADGA